MSQKDYIGTAVLSGNIKDVRNLLENGTDDPIHKEGISDKDFEMALELATLYSHLDILKLLLEDPRGVRNTKWQNLFYKATSSGNINMIKFIFKKLEHNESNLLIAKCLNENIESCAGGNNSEILEYLLERMTEYEPGDMYMSTHDNDALMFAAQNNQINNIKILIADNRVNFNYFSVLRAIGKAEEYGRKEIIGLLEECIH